MRNLFHSQLAEWIENITRSMNGWMDGQQSVSLRLCVIKTIAARLGGRSVYVSTAERQTRGEKAKRMMLFNLNEMMEKINRQK